MVIYFCQYTKNNCFIIYTSFLIVLLPFLYSGHCKLCTILFNSVEIFQDFISFILPSSNISLSVLDIFSQLILLIFLTSFHFKHFSAVEVQEQIYRIYIFYLHCCWSILPNWKRTICPAENKFNSWCAASKHNTTVILKWKALNAYDYIGLDT